MTTALYRRYRPETFGEMIGQSQVTDPLMTALRGDRVGHAYLFSGPRGCGKTTSARILARCLNCAEGPTDTPCGVCPSCVELSRAGGGSLDVVEIDAASHNGVDDARDLRERATFAPSRDRFKIFILDEAHMVTPQGFNALLKLVEEPPAHVKFIFATTEPEKVLGTIRSRTHHYPFRLVPPAAMLEYVEKLCAEEGVQVAQGVLPLVVRAGGGSPRDTLSLLDQLIAGSDSAEGSTTPFVTYERAVALLGYTHAALLDEIVDALAAGDASAAFPAVDRVIQTGQDPRRFVDDLLERLRDLIVIAAVGDGASAVLRGIPDDELQRMRTQAGAFGAARLSRTADLVSQALDDMTGATSPRLHLELMVARVLAGAPAGAASSTTPVVERASGSPSPVVERASAASETKRADADGTERAAPASGPEGASASPSPVAEPARPVVERASAASETKRADAEGTERAAPASVPAGASASPSPVAEPAPPVVERASAASETKRPDAGGTEHAAPASAPAASGPVTFARITSAWPTILTRLETISRASWLVVTAVQPLAYDSDSEVLTLGFTSPSDVARFKGTTPGKSTSDHLRSAIEQELGVRVKYRPAPLPPGGGSAPGSTDGPDSGGGSSRPPAGPASPAAGSGRAAPSGAGRPMDDAPAAGWAGAAPSGGRGPASDSEPTPSAPAPPAGGTRAASAAVTEWAVAPIPTSAPAVAVAEATPPAPQFAVDEEPAEVEAAASAPAAPVDGAADTDVPPLPDDDYPPYDDEPPYDPAYDGPPEPLGQRQAPGVRTAAPVASAPDVPARTAAPTRPDRVASPAATPTVSTRAAAPQGVQRYGEAVVRQVLGARFVREEPFQPPTRFS
ncbi:DNA polymerase III subunit gamma and tau [Microbacterium sp.]|uniref:DNA polymerase III subunit gamma and tau n=1 Tax=Microbacterium sp. TaxID=51671 RepID=UPI0028112246|nr:DNA polymerase III subunit gamma and tau [Microbacterium sp.]